MARFYYYVVTSGTEWEVKFDGQGARTFKYPTQAAAVNAAATAARTTHDNQNGRLTGVRIQGANSQWRDERTYGLDPHPPRG